MAHVGTCEIEGRKEHSVAFLRASTGRKGVDHNDQGDQKAENGDCDFQNDQSIVDLCERVSQVAGTFQNQNAINVFCLNVFLRIVALAILVQFRHSIRQFIEFRFAADAQSVELDVGRCERRTVVMLMVMLVQIVAVIAAIVAILDCTRYVCWPGLAQILVTQTVQL